MRRNAGEGLQQEVHSFLRFQTADETDHHFVIRNAHGPARRCAKRRVAIYASHAVGHDEDFSPRYSKGGQMECFIVGDGNDGPRYQTQAHFEASNGHAARRGQARLHGERRMRSIDQRGSGPAEPRASQQSCFGAVAVHDVERPMPAQIRAQPENGRHVRGIDRVAHREAHRALELLPDRREARSKHGVCASGVIREMHGVPALGQALGEIGDMAARAGAGRFDQQQDFHVCSYRVVEQAFSPARLTLRSASVSLAFSREPAAGKA